ncbi:nucleotidyl transferase AbiEii/AbiGii toxin family protein [Spirosoma radiotolerans]|uniref:nucleotidyl transferase AbiEii/AbiGii toxin family protein n=1 Tax=Spirosoma radiotolerans TaxID=1379870 RepID=UPI001D121907|nr:nucleotidyl transferase AbiEii/AbiGii toxin family protein [Spirosoma radiotolerans]
MELLKRLMQEPFLAPFALAGGTNLALRYGHRLSIDLDLFTSQSFNEQQVFDQLVIGFPTIIKTDESKNTLSLFIEGVKVDLIAHRYPLLTDFTKISDVRLWSAEDVIAMKLGAVSGRGAKKDFWDLAELLNHFSLAQMLQFFTAKYSNSDPGYVVRSLTYFDDAELQADPITLNGITWPQVKQRVLQAVRGLL